MKKSGSKKLCATCGTSFYVQAHRADAKFCSMECLWTGRKRRLLKVLAVTCCHCGKSYEVEPYRKDMTKFCSLKCAALADPGRAEKARRAPRKQLDPEIKKARKRASDRASYLAHRDARSAADAARYLANIEARKAVMREWRAANPDKVKAANQRKRQLRGDELRAKRRQHYRDNKALYVANARKREEWIKRAIPPWADLDKIAQFYIEADRLTRETGAKYHVDHVIPLRGKLVSGLHVETNLQVIPAVINLKKSNAIEFVAKAA